jgi:peroxiredoxin/outer membrane lipoprotein-sorting protein
MPHHEIKVSTLLLLTTACAFCQDAKVIAQKVAARYKGLTGYQVQGTYEIAGGHSSEVGALAWTTAKFLIEVADKGAKQRLEYKGTNLAIDSITNGSTIWTYVPAEKTYTQVEAVAEEDSDDPEQTAETSKSDNSAQGVYSLVVRRYAEFDKLAKLTTIDGEQQLKIDGGKVACWVLITKYPDREEKTWVAQDSALVLRSEAKIKAKDLTAEIKIAVKRFELEPPRPDQFVFTPGKKDKLVDELNIPGAAPIFVGKPAKDFALKSVDGANVRLSEFRGKIVVLDFWATWCPPCRQELPTINKLSAKLKASDVVFFGINNEGAGTVRKFNEKNDYTFPTLEDPGRKVASAYGARAIPNVFVIGKDGVIVKHFIGSRDESALMAGIQEAQRHQP